MISKLLTVLLGFALIPILWTGAAQSEELCVGAVLREVRAPDPREPREPPERGNPEAEARTYTTDEDFNSTIEVTNPKLKEVSEDPDSIETSNETTIEGGIDSTIVVACKYDYEAYVSRGTCRGRDGGHNTSARVTLRITSPGYLNRVRRTATQYVQFDDRITGFDLNCADACASATARMSDGRFLRRNIRCNVKSYK